MTDRNALHDLDTNARRTPLLRLKSGAKPSITAIPRPAVVPDVFAPDIKKRPAEFGHLPPVKRSRNEQQQYEAHREIDERWRSKWSKAFPTLRFYFETDDAISKQLRFRVARMGATVEPFFSSKVTHLINATFRQKPAIPDSPGNPFTGNRDLASKAAQIGIKVWNTTKLGDILDKIAPVQTTTKDSLSTLLHDEKQNGTRERDPLALRTDYTYFNPSSHFLLLQDATGRSRPIMVKEFEKEKEYPVLHDSFLRISSSNHTTISTEQLRDRAWALYVDRVAYQGELPTRQRRAETPRLPEARPYANASGNSVVITSNIASTSNPSPFTQPIGGKVMQMSKRVQVLKTNARAYRPQPDDIFSIPSGVPLQPKEFRPQEQVIHMLAQLREPRHEHVAAQFRRANREKVDARVKAKEQDGSAGYCENCRVRFADLSQHLVHKKHRRFAQDPANFASLDTFLKTIQRPPNTSTQTPDFPPCHERHTKDVFCELCAYYE